MGSHTKAPAVASGEARRILDAFRRLVQSLRTFDRGAEKAVGLSGAAVFVLQKLGDGKPISVNELAERTHTHQSSVSVVVQKLVARKLVQRRRSPEDARRAELSITAKGMAVLEEVPEAAQDRLIAALQRLPVTRRRELAVALEMLVEQTGHDGRPPSLFFEESHSGKGAKRKYA